MEPMLRCWAINRRQKLRVLFFILLSVTHTSPVYSFWFDEWTGFVYPNRNNLENHIEIGTFKKLDECRNAAISIMQNNGWAVEGDFECGLNCNRKTMPMVCKETSR